MWTSYSYAFYPAANYMFKVNHGNTRRRCEICSKLTIKTSERRQWGGSGAFIFNFEHISHLVLVFLLLTLSRQMPAGLRIFQANIHLFKVSNRNTRKRCKTLKRHQNYVIDVVPLSLKSLNIFQTFLQCFCCWLWTGKCLLEEIWLEIHLYWK